MSPNVVDAAKRLPFDAAAYIWIDIKDLPDLPMEERRQRLRDRGHNPDSTSFSSEMPLPFEKFAVVLPPFDFDPINVGSVLTIHREPGKFTMYGWREGFDDCIFTFKAVPHPDPALLGIQEQTWVTHDKRLPIAKYPEEEIKDRYAEVMSMFVANMTCLCAGIYGTQRETYRCTGNAAVNAKRRRHNKKPLYDWHTVVVETVKSASSGTHGCTHATPRLHDVRGHWVKSKLGKLYWRKAHKRGDASKGVIFHDYIAVAT